MTTTFWLLILKRNLFGSGRVRFCGLEEVPIFGQGRFPKEASALPALNPTTTTHVMMCRVVRKGGMAYVLCSKALQGLQFLWLLNICHRMNVPSQRLVQWQPGTACPCRRPVRKGLQTEETGSSTNKGGMVPSVCECAY